MDVADDACTHRYNVRKRVEHLVKVPLQGSGNMSVVDPELYSSRFLKFLLESVFVGPTAGRS